MLVKDCCTGLAPFLTTLFNKSIASSDVPPTLKKAFITPLSKKQNLNADELSNYRPVSNLSFISKQLEKVIASRLVSYLNDNNLLAKNQSAYRRFHSTETSLLRLMSDLVQPSSRISSISCPFLTWVPLSILSTTTYSSKNYLYIRNTWRRIKLDNVLPRGRIQSVKIDISTSAETLLSHGVPQGSLRGPILFILYTG